MLSLAGRPSPTARPPRSSRGPRASRSATSVLSEEDFSGSLAAQGWQPEQIAMFAGLFQGVRQGWSAPISPDVASVLGRPPITLEQFAQDHAAIWR